MQANPQTYYGLNLIRVWKSRGAVTPPPAFGAGRWIYYGEKFQGLSFIKVWSSRGSAGDTPPEPSASGFMIYKRRRR